jgi:hypothetical protein
MPTAMGGTTMTELAGVFKLNPKGLNVRRGLGVLAVMGLPLIVLHVLDQEVYYLSLAFGALFVGLNDPGREYGYRLPRLALNAVAGALLPYRRSGRDGLQVSA